MTPVTEAAVDLEWHALSEAEIRQFDEQGYLVVRNVLDRAMVELIIGASDRLISSNRRENRTASDSALLNEVAPARQLSSELFIARSKFIYCL